jgi:hypothetical protein
MSDRFNDIHAKNFDWLVELNDENERIQKILSCIFENIKTKDEYQRLVNLLKGPIERCS